MSAITITYVNVNVTSQRIGKAPGLLLTLSALNDPVAIVHIPVDLADTYSTHLYWSLMDAPGLSDEFFNVTSNQIEVGEPGVLAQ